MPLAYLPDADEIAPGMLRDVSECIPTAKGYASDYAESVWKPAYGASVDLSAMAGEKLNSLFAMWNNTTIYGRIFVGTNTNLYELTDSGSRIVLTKRSEGGGPYTNTTTANENASEYDIYPNTWAWCSYGDIVFATNKDNSLQYSSGTTFASLAGAPAGAAIDTVKDFIFIGNCTTYGSVTGAQDMLAWSAQGDYTNWVPDARTRAGWARFTDTPGRITAVKKLRDYIAVFKSSACYLGTEIDPPGNWAFQKISDRIGCMSKQSVVDVGNALVFVGPEDIYFWDGNQPRSITDGIYETISPHLWAFNQGSSPPTFRVGYNKPANRVTFYGINPQTYGTDIYHYYLRNGTWGKGTGTIQGNLAIPMQTNVATMGLAGSGNKLLGDIYTATGDGLNNGGALYNRIADNGHSNAYFTLGAFGRNGAETRISRVYPRFITNPTSATMTPYTKNSFGAAWGAGNAVTMDARIRFDYQQAAMWHSFKIATVGEMEIADVMPEAKAAGQQ